MRHVARFLAAVLAASLLSIVSPAQAAPVLTTSGAVTASVATADAPLTAAQKRKLKKAKKKAKKKRQAKKRMKRIMRVAARYRGTPYRWGGASPSGFDCSGYVQYVMKKAIDKKLPRIAGDQMNKGKKVANHKKRKGDLIGFSNGSYVYHIGIYAGGGKIWHSPRPGKKVEKVKIWTSSYSVRRL